MIACPLCGRIEYQAGNCCARPPDVLFLSFAQGLDDHPPSMSEEFPMYLKSAVAVFLIAAVPVCAHAQQKAPPKATKADAERVVKIISGDKAKTQQFCELAKLDDQIGEAESKKDTKKVEELTQQLGR